MTQPALSKMHELKTWPVAFEAVRSTAKTADFRKDDRPGGFQIGDLLKLREYDPQTKSYSGREMTVTVTDVQRGPDWGIPEGYAAMSVRDPIREAEQRVVEAAEAFAKADRNVNTRGHTLDDIDAMMAAKHEVHNTVAALAALKEARGDA